MLSPQSHIYLVPIPALCDVGFLTFPGAIQLVELLSGSDELDFIVRSSLQSWVGALISCTLCFPDLGFVSSLVTVSGSVWEVTLLSSSMRKKFSHFLKYLFSLSSVGPRIFLFILLDFLICLDGSWLPIQI